MTERGILFTPENYTKCENGTKTQTRRIVKHPDYFACLTGDCPHEDRGLCDAEMPVHCPFGQPGDRLYVKEGLREDGDSLGVCYRRDNVPIHGRQWQWQKDTLSPLHMPKWAARLWLELTGVRVERLNSISGPDAAAEGIQFRKLSDGVPLSGDMWKPTIDAFRELWESINGPGSWDLNPWVWVLEFRKL